METNALPKYDMSDNPTHCCPRFNPQGWDELELHFKDNSLVYDVGLDGFLFGPGVRF